MAILNFFCVMVLRFYIKKSQVILIKNEGVTAIFPNFDFILNRENQHHGFIFALFLKKNSFNCLFTTRGTEIPLIINPI